MLTPSTYSVQLSELPQLQFRPIKRDKEAIQGVPDVTAVAIEVHKAKSQTTYSKPTQLRLVHRASQINAPWSCEAAIATWNHW